MSETRTFQGHTYTRNGPGEQWVLAGPAPSAGRTGVIVADPYKDKSEQRADTSTAMDVKRAQLQETNTRREVDRTRLQNPQDLRQEYEKLPEVQQYRLALQQANRGMDTDANPQGDLALTYAFAKAMDPSSAVREGEQASVANSQPMFQAMVEKIKKQFGMDGAGSYTPQARAQLRQEIFRQAASLKPLYDRARADMTDNARAVGVDPKEVIGREDTAAYEPLFRAYGEKAGDPAGVISRLVGGEPIKGAGVNAPPPDGGIAGYGATKAGGKIPDQMQADYYRYLNQNWGKLDPDAFANFRAGLDQKYGFGSNLDGYRSDAQKLNEIALKGQGPEVVGRLTAPDVSLSAEDQARNNALTSPIGGPITTAVLSAANAGGFGVPQLIASEAAPDAAQKFDAMRRDNWKSALVGDIGGAAAGAGATSKILGAGSKTILESGGNPTVARLLAKPLTADMTYGGLYGMNDATAHGRDPIVGGLTGAAAGFIGNKVGGAVGKAFPGSVGFGKNVRAIDSAVPTSDALKAQAGDLYSAAEARGLTATPDETLALADSTKALLAKEGRITPKDDLTDVQAKTKEAYRLIDAHAGEPMTPMQIQTVRGVIADGGASTDAGERRISRLLLDNFDNWTNATNPDLASSLRDARGVASRYLQGDKIASLRDLAEPGAGQYTQSGMGNALRTQYRGLDRAITRGSENFAPNVVDAVQDVARGTPFRNALRYVGKLAPTGQMGMFGTLGATAAGASAAGPAGGAAPLGLAALGAVARRAEAGLADRAATVAENSAYGGQDYTDAISRVLAAAQQRGGNYGTGLLIGGGEQPTSDLIARLLLGQQQPVPVN